MKYSRTQLARAYVRLLDKYSSHDLAKGFADIVRSHGATRDVAAFGDEVERLWGDAHSTVLATVRSARKLSSQAEERISSYLKNAEKKDHVRISYIHDLSLIGGAHITTPTHTYDFSVHHTLKQIL